MLDKINTIKQIKTYVVYMAEMKADGHISKEELLKQLNYMIEQEENHLYAIGHELSKQ